MHDPAIRLIPVQTLEVPIGDLAPLEAPACGDVDGAGVAAGEHARVLVVVACYGAVVAVV